MWPFHRTKRDWIDPHQVHAFEEPSDMGMSAAASGSSAISINTANVIGVTAATQRATRCAVPACGRLHGDPIHMPVDD
jgi:hypothetical protein